MAEQPRTERAPSLAGRTGAKALVIVPTYNERANVMELVARLFAASGDSAEVLVIDDSSPDGTGEVVAELAAVSERVRLIERTSKQGLGSAYVLGFRWALARRYWAVVEMDADLSHDPADVPRLLEALVDADLVIGSRYVSGGGISDWGPLRRSLSRAANLYSRLCLRLGVNDSTSGFRAYRTTLLAAQRLEEIQSDGYVFQIEMTRRAHAAGARIREIPIRFTDRVLGRSKIDRRIVWEALLRVTLWGLSDRLARRRLAIRSKR